MQLQEIKKLQSQTKKLKLLYVEDNSQTRDSTLLLFERFFDDIVVAVDGKDGVDKFYESDIDIIFTDIEMPNMNGLEMISKINTIANKNIPIIVFSAYGESSYLLKAIKSGVDAYLIKPVELDDFMSELHRVINKEFKAKEDLVEIDNNYTWDNMSQKLYYQLVEVRLTKNEILLLELMSSNKNLIYSDELIIEQVWMNEFGINKSNVKNLIKRLNDKLPKKLIKNIYSVGYSLI